jgi:hypothetical protein
MKFTFTNYLIIYLICFATQALAQSGATFKQWGEESLTQIEKDFRMPGSNLYYENSSRSAPSFIWPGGIQLAALIAAGKISQAEAYANEIHAKYWCYYNNRWGYNSGANSCGDRYYDDNAWMAKDLMELYNATKNVTYLNRAKDVVAFSMSGENHAGDNPDGGIRWHEPDNGGTCICATAPTIVSNLMIYQATNTQQYLTDATRLYTWAKNKGFGIGPGYRGYENAVVTQAAILLYKITGDATCLNDARHMGLAMETAYVKWSTHALRETGQWGGHDMTNAYVELWQLDNDIYWLNIAAGYLKFLHDNCKDANGRYPENWDAAGTAGNPALIYQAPPARAYEKMGTTPGATAKYPDPVALFRDCNFDGWWNAGFFIGKYTSADLNFHYVPVNDISSVKVQPGYKVTFYDQDNFQGASLVKTSDASCLVNDGWNDRAKSMIVEVISPVTTVYKDCGYSGRAIHLPVGDYTLSQLQARSINDNDISSLSISSGYEVVLYELDNFQGASVKLTTDTWCLVQTDNNWNDKVSSLKVRVACVESPITPYLSINGGSQQQASAATMVEGNLVTLSPQATTTGGTWSWAGPNNFTSTSRELSLNNIQINQAGNYVVSYTNASGCQSTQTFAITVNPNLVGTFYKDCNYGGYAVSLSPGNYNLAALTAKGILDNDISSLKVNAGYEVVLFTDDNFGGTSLVVGSDNSCLVNNSFNDLATSLKIRPVVNGNGNGLTGNYFNGMNFETPVLNRVDATVNADWANGSPDPLVHVDQFSIRWTGQVQPRYTETYTFYVTTDDGGRLWINNQLIVDKWRDDGGTLVSGTISLTAGQKYDIKLEYYENGGGAKAILEWSSASQSRQVVPQAQLYSNALPVVTITSPATNSSSNAPANLTLAATASDSDGSVSKVDYYNGTTLIASTPSPYTYAWNNVAAGSYSITAIATDNGGGVSVSVPVSVTVKGGTGNQSPIVNITSPSNNASFNAPASISVTASASDADGTISKVEFFNGTTLIGSATQSPYTISWSNVAAGTYSLTAKATDNGGASTVSAPISVTVKAIVVNQAPTVSITSPSNNASYNAPASISFTASANDADGTISKVEFLNGSTSIGSVTKSPYSVTWSNVAAGTYTITAKATDNSNATTSSSSITVVVKSVTTDICSGLAQYVENGGYVDGSKVKNAGSSYQCKPYPYTGWCNGAAWAYAPGTGSYWQDAWILIGSCTASASSASLPTSILSPNPATDVLNINLNESSIVTIYNAMGNVAFPTTHVQANGTLNISNVPGGVYDVRIETLSQVINVRLVKN